MIFVNHFKINFKMIGYKIASSEGKRVLVTLEIPSDANTNLDRKNVKDKLYAKYRCDKAFVLCIEDEEGKKYKSASTSIFSFKKIKYVVGEEIFEKDYNKDVNVVCGEGIHFFLSKEVALLYGLDKIENGEYKIWDDNGHLVFNCNYEEGKIEGECKRWYISGKIWDQCYFKNDKLEGEYKEWFTDGKLHIHCQYKEGKLEGEYKEWFSDGKLNIHCHYKEGKLEGEYKEWFADGKLHIHCHYKEGKLEGQYKQWDEDGKLIKDEVYVNGEKIK